MAQRTGRRLFRAVLVSRTAFATVELPLVLGSLAMLATGAIVTYQHGRVTLGAGIAFALGLPLVVAVAAAVVDAVRRRLGRFGRR